MSTFCEACGIDMGAGEDKLCAQCHNASLTLAAEKKPRFTVNQFGTVYEDGIPRFSLMGDVQAALHSLNGQADYIEKLRRDKRLDATTIDACGRQGQTGRRSTGGAHMTHETTARAGRVHYSPEHREQFLASMMAELQHAYDKHGARPWSRHEFYAVLREEVDEAWDAIKSDAPMTDLLKEVMQIACVCLRFVETPEAYKGPHPLPLPCRVVTPELPTEREGGREG